MTIAEHLRRATATLRQTSDSPRLDAEILLSFILQQDRAGLLMHGGDQLDPATAQNLSILILRRAHNIPVSYLTGRQEFYGLALEVTPDVLVPRPATELLVAAVRQCLPIDSPITIADVGTGSGAIALALATHLPRATIIASDISLAALAVARRNARRLGLAGRIIFCQSSLLPTFPAKPGPATTDNVQPQFVVANLPYLRPNQLLEPSIRHEPRLALDGGKQGLGLVHQLIDQCGARPTIAGLTLELDPQQVPDIRRRLIALWPGRTITEINDGRTARGLISWKQKEPT